MLAQRRYGALSDGATATDGRIRWYDREEYSLDKDSVGRGLLFLYRETGQEKSAGSKAAYGAIAASAPGQNPKFLA